MKRALLITATLSTLAGCASIENSGKKIAEIPSAPINTHSVGDAFVYSDGYIEEVIATSPNEISWALGPIATVATRTVNFFDPTIHWQLSGSTYKFAKSSRTGSLWPMRESAAESLTGQMTVEHRNGSQSFDQTWNCNVSHSEHLELSSGSFDTFVVDCRRQSESGAHWQRRRFNYAPTLGHYVRVIEEMRAHGYPGYVFKQRDLVYYRVKNSAQFTSAFQKALGMLSSGQSFTAENNGLAYTAEIRSTSMNEAQMVCRELQVRDERSESYRADYCLTHGVWSMRSMKYGEIR